MLRALHRAGHLQPPVHRRLTDPAAEGADHRGGDPPGLPLLLARRASVQVQRPGWHLRHLDLGHVLLRMPDPVQAQDPNEGPVNTKEFIIPYPGTVVLD